MQKNSLALCVTQLEDGVLLNMLEQLVCVNNFSLIIQSYFLTETIKKS